jgi:hypothetical protein
MADDRSHPLNTSRMLATYGLLTVSGIGLALMSFQLFVLGALICIASAFGIASLYWSDLQRMRLKLVDREITSSLSQEHWIALVMIAVAIAAPLSVYLHGATGALAPTAESDKIATWQLTGDQRARLVAGLRLPPGESHSIEINSAPSCDPCEQFAEELRQFVSSMPGWKADGGPLIFRNPFRRGLKIVTRSGEKEFPVVKQIVTAFEDAGMALPRDTEDSLGPGTIVIVVGRHGTK